MKPKHLIVNLLLATEEPISAHILVGVCQLFGITPNNARVTLARLTADNMVDVPQRGFYQLGQTAEPLAEALADWREKEATTCEWNQDWIGVFIGALGRTDRTGLRRRMRVLNLAGFEELEQGLFIRPNNLKGGVSALRTRLYHFGLEEKARVFSLGDLSDAEQKQAIGLWDVDALMATYQQDCDEMLDWLAGMDALTLEEAARQSFVMGDAVLRRVAYDPMLPAEMIDVALRAKRVEIMVEYDRVGKTFFYELYRSLSEA
ncbi:hypothetical protein R50073_10040 [Maricurvus nonylphenolicus]|uniref:hypothetical protein n=1 Tax=Maricurvus nonylphenolicus TaxID=1008307 RepID=UPI0036F36B2F